MEITVTTERTNRDRAELSAKLQVAVALNDLHVVLQTAEAKDELPEDCIAKGSVPHLGSLGVPKPFLYSLACRNLCAPRVTCTMTSCD